MVIMKRLKQHWATFLVMVVQAAGMLMFASSFFSVDDKILSDMESSDLRTSILSEKTLDQMARIETSCIRYKKHRVVDKAVLVIIDALRADFIPSIVNSSISQSSHLSMPFVESLLKEKKAVGLVSEAQTPTVTLPRIKAILSGTYPSFMDLVKNLNAPRFGDDNFLDQLYQRNDRVVFYGDETWLSMFPFRYFLRFNGTSSFFATDYTSVDVNVTENAIPELSRLEEWDAMILHYLGVDHIGHSHGGASSRIMPSKLLEMDAVVKEIYSAVSKADESYLLIITGDHGMTDAGNHGGSSQEESDTAVVFIRTPIQVTQSVPSFSAKEKRMMQVDLAVTISSLLGLPIPDKSKGLLSLPVLKQMGVSNSHVLCLMFNNSLHLQRMVTPVVASEVSLFSKAIAAHFEYISHSNRETIHSNSSKGSVKTATTAAKYYALYSERIQKAIMNKQSTQTSFFSLLTLGILISFASTIFVFMMEASHSNPAKPFQPRNGRQVISRYSSLESTPTTYSILMSIVSLDDPDVMGLIFLLHFAFHSICLMSTSFIEMENYYWHFLSSSLILNHFIFFLTRKMFVRQRMSQVKEQQQRESFSEDETCNKRTSSRSLEVEVGVRNNLHSASGSLDFRHRKKDRNKLHDAETETSCFTTKSPKENRHVSIFDVDASGDNDNDRRRQQRGNQKQTQRDSFEDNMLSCSSGDRKEEEEHLESQEEHSKNALKEGRKVIQRLYTDYFFVIRPVIYLSVLIILRVTSCWTTVENEATLNKSQVPSFKDIRSYLQSEEQKHLLSSLVILTFICLTFLTPSTKLGKQHCLLGSGFFWIYLFRADSSNGSNRVLGFNTKILSEVGLDFSLSPNTKARLVYIHIVFIVVDAVAQRLKLDTNWLYLDDFIKKYTDESLNSNVSYRDQIKKLSCLRILSTCLVLISCLLLRVDFIPLFGLNILMEKLLFQCVVRDSSSQKVLHHLIIMYVTLAFGAFYSQGNSNSISSIDTSSGYIALESFNLILVSLQVMLSTYAGFIYWIIMLFVRVQESKTLVHHRLKERQMMSLVHLLLLQRYWVMSLFQVVCLLLQNHLFIWSVISPKLLYEAFFTLLSDVILSILFILHILDQ